MAEQPQDFLAEFMGADTEGASTQDEVAQPVAQEQEQRKPDTEQAETQPAQEERKPEKVDLTSLPEFREWQSKTDREMAQLRQQVEAERQRVAAEQARIREERMAGMDDFERTQFERDEYANQVQTLQQQLAEREAMAYRDQKVAEIQQRIAQETGITVPRDQLDLSSPDAAERSAYSFAVKQLKSGQTEAVKQEAQQLAQQRQANTVDLGGGAPKTAEARYKAQIRQARDSGDVSAYLDLMEQAKSEGVTIY